MAPCREDLIRTTIESVRGANRVIVHIHLPTSSDCRQMVLDMSEQETVDLAVHCTRLIRELTKDAKSDAETARTRWRLEFTLENFQDTEPEYALSICEAIKAAWQPSNEDQIIFNLAATLEMSMPNVFADQVEYFCEHISEREKVCVSVHNHNDRGCAVAAAEMAQLAGADRVEGCLFGNGERTGNVDLVTLALNLFRQGIWPGIDFSRIKDVVDMVESLTRIPVHFRAPYAGKYAFCTFTGIHQDAIRKGYRAQRAEADTRGELGESSSSPRWRMPYLPMDPADIGREHEPIIRVNSQSGKSGIWWLVNEVFGRLDMPPALELDFTAVCKSYADKTASELTGGIVEKLFRTRYMPCDPANLEPLSCNFFGGETNAVDNLDDLAPFLDGFLPYTKGRRFGLIQCHKQHTSIQDGSFDRGRTVVCVELNLWFESSCRAWGVGISEKDLLAAAIQAVSSKNHFLIHLPKANCRTLFANAQTKLVRHGENGGVENGV